MAKIKTLQLFFSLIFLLNFSFQNNSNLQKNIINNYYSSFFFESTSYQNFDEFYEGNLNNNQSSIILNFAFNLTENDSGEIFFDYQSEFGCLNVTFENGKFLEGLCAKDKNNFFVLNINDYYEKSEYEKKEIKMRVKIEYNPLIFKDDDFNFDFSLKVSLKKSINILKINSEHKILCKMEKIENEKYRCLFVVINDKINNDEEDNKSLIIFPLVNENSNEFDIYADYINKDIYEQFNKETLNDSIPNENSPYKNNNINQTRTNFIRIPKVNESQYIYINIESNKSNILELISQKTSENQTSYSFSKNSNKIQLFSINQNSAKIKLDFNNTDLSNNFFLLTTIQGKSTINLGYDNNTKYTIDEIESNLYLDIDNDSCSSDNCQLVFDKLDENIIFYLSYYKKENNNLMELVHGKSSRFSFNKISKNILLYEHIPQTENDKTINVNLQLYKCEKINNINDTFKVETILLSQDDIQKIKENDSYINNFENRTEGELNPLTLATNIHLENINSNETYLLIIITPKFNYSINHMILGTTISLSDSLIYPAERIYHFGELNGVNKTTYKLKGNKKYHLMRLEFGQNCEDVKWTVKRTYEQKYENYSVNDTELSFVVEYWSNGRELLTMYIEDGEDIYLTIFTSNNPKDNLKRNFAFKYINSGKNGDFKNYVLKNDQLEYDIEERTIKINKLWKSPPSNLALNYYMRIIHRDNYISNENLKSISLIESKGIFKTKATVNEEDMIYYVKQEIDKFQNYTANCYITIIENYNDIELLAYNYSLIDALHVDEPSIGLMIAAISIAGVAFITFWIRLFHHCCCVDDYRYSYNNKKGYNSYLI